MKLLSKQKVTSQIEDQRRLQIEEGLTLARKVDTLRQKLADIQRQHDVYILGMQETLKQRTSKLFDDIQIKEAEIKLLEIKRKELLAPLDDAWSGVKLKEKSLDDLKNELHIREFNLKQKETSIDEKNEKARETLNHIKIRERELSKVYDEAETNLEITERAKVKMIEDKEKKEKSYSKKDSELKLREDSIVSYEFTLKKREETIEMAEKEIADERIRLNDQRETLKRALNRIKK